MTEQPTGWKRGMKSKAIVNFLSRENESALQSTNHLAPVAVLSTHDQK